MGFDKPGKYQDRQRQVIDDATKEANICAAYARSSYGGIGCANGGQMLEVISGTGTIFGTIGPAKMLAVDLIIAVIVGGSGAMSLSKLIRHHQFSTSF